MLENTKGAIKLDIEHTRHRTKINKTKNTTQKTKKMNNTDSIKNWGLTQVLEMGKQFLILIRHPLCYSYSHIR